MSIRAIVNGWSKSLSLTLDILHVRIFPHQPSLVLNNDYYDSLIHHHYHRHLRGEDRAITEEKEEEESSRAIWFAVPKKRISKSKKRIKNYLKRTALKVKDNIIVDGRTGELTLRHHLPFNWKDYLPEENVRKFTWDDYLPARQAENCKLRPFRKRNSDRLFLNKLKNK